MILRTTRQTPGDLPENIAVDMNRPPGLVGFTSFFGLAN